jgi:hypothetical protein
VDRVEAETKDLPNLSMFQGGVWTPIERALGLQRRDGRPSVPGIALICVAIWAPLLILRGLQSGSFSDASRLILGDFALTARCLVTAPILLFAGWMVDRRISFMLRGVIAEEIVAPSQGDALDTAMEKARRRATGGGPLLALAVLALVASIFVPPSPASEPWAFMGPKGHAGLSWAGIWHAAVARPIPLFLVLLWLWRWTALTLFALTIVRLPLQLRMGHPDRVGGLAIMGDLASAAGPMIFASGAVVSANLMWQMVNLGTPLTAEAPVIIGFIALAMLYGLGPQLLFAPALLRLRYKAALAYGALSALHAQLFEDRWFGRGKTTSELLGAPEISSLTDLASTYQLVREIQPLPFARSTVVSLFLSAAIPMLPAVLLEAPLKEILLGLLRVLV